MKLQERFERFKATWSAIKTDSSPEALSRLHACEEGIADSCSELDAHDMEWLLSSIGDPDKRRFVPLVLYSVKTLDDRFLIPLVREAVYEVDPSLNGFYIRPAVKLAGACHVMRMLFDVIKTGNVGEQAGAIQVLHHVGVPLVYPRGVTDYSIENATPESREAYLRADEIRREIYTHLLELFVRTSDSRVQREIMPVLTLGRPDLYPESHRQLVKLAISIAESHPDEYFRDRLRDQLAP